MASERSSRRIGSEAPPSDQEPADQEALGMDEGAVGSDSGIYFTKVQNRALWHCYDKNDDPIGTVKQNATTGIWQVKIGSVTVPFEASSGPAAKAFFYGYEYALRGTNATAGQSLQPSSEAGHAAGAETQISG